MKAYACAALAQHQHSACWLRTIRTVWTENTCVNIYSGQYGDLSSCMRHITKKDNIDCLKASTYAVSWEDWSVCIRKRVPERSHRHTTLHHAMIGDQEQMVTGCWSVVASARLKATGQLRQHMHVCYTEKATKAWHMHVWCPGAASAAMQRARRWFLHRWRQRVARRRVDCTMRAGLDRGTACSARGF